MKYVEQTRKVTNKEKPYFQYSPQKAPPQWFSDAYPDCGTYIIATYPPVRILRLPTPTANGRSEIDDGEYVFYVDGDIYVLSESDMFDIIEKWLKDRQSLITSV